MQKFGDISFVNNRNAKGKLGQIGSFSYVNHSYKPHISRLRLYESMWRQDITVKAALAGRANTIVSGIGEITHPDSEISEFLNNNIKTIEDVNGKSWHEILTDFQITSDWAGFCLAEKIFKVKFGSLYLQDLVPYHPFSINFYTNDKGKLVDGEKSTTGGHRKSGVWQHGGMFETGEVNIPLWRTVLLNNEADFGNYYGRSLIAPSYKWARLKESLIDIMVSKMPSVGDRMVILRAISRLTEQIRNDPSTGQEKRLTTLELISEVLENSEDLPQFLMLDQQDTPNSADATSVPLSDAFGDAFLNPIRFADEESVRHIIPYFLISDSYDATNDTQTLERRMETFYAQTDLAREKLMSLICKKAFQDLVTWNFSRESATIPPQFARTYSDRAEGRVATMQMLKGSTEIGIINPKNPMDWSAARQMLRMPDRVQDKEDIKYINQVVISPRQKTARVSDTGNNGTGAAGRPTGNATPQINSRATLE